MATCPLQKLLTGKLINSHSAIAFGGGTCELQHEFYKGWVDDYFKFEIHYGLHTIPARDALDPACESILVGFWC